MGAEANDCDRGLAAYLFTTDYAQAWRVSSALESGMVGVNDVAISTPETPFGGFKTSGIGKEGLDLFGTSASLPCSAIFGPKRAILDPSAHMIEGWQWPKLLQTNLVYV